MGYEYDFVFDWMVKKSTPAVGPKPGEEEEKKDEAREAP